MGTLIVLIFIIILLFILAWFKLSYIFEKIGDFIDNKILKPFNDYDEGEDENEEQRKI